MSDDYEFNFADQLEQEESAMLEQVFALVDILEMDIPHAVKIFNEYVNHPDIPGMYNNRTNQVYLHKDILHSNIEEALHVYLHEANHHITGLDDSSRGFADNLCHMLSNLLLRYSRDAGISGKVYLSDTGSITIPIPFTGSQATYANIAAIGNKLLIYANNSLLEIDLPIVLATPVCGVKKVCYMDNSYQLKLPSKLVSALGYVTKVELMNCVIRFNNSLFSPALKKLK